MLMLFIVIPICPGNAEQFAITGGSVSYYNALYYY